MSGGESSRGKPFPRAGSDTRAAPWRIDVATGVIDWSDELRALYRLPAGAEAPNFEEFYDVDYPDDRQILREAMDRAIHQGEAFDERFHIRRVDGTTGIFQTMAFPIPGPNGETAEIVGFAYDVTAEIEAERQLHFRAELLDRVDVAVVAIDLELRVTHWNRGAEELYGWTAAETLGKTSAEIGMVPEVMTPQREALLEELGAATGPVTRELDLRNKAGESLAVVVTTSPIEDERGEAIGYVGVGVDVSERIRAIEEAQENRDLLRAVIEGSPIPIFLRDKEYRYVMVNEAGARTLGRERSEMIGRTDVEVLGEQALELIRPSDHRILASGEPHRFEEALDVAEGRRDFLMHRFPLKSAAGEVWGYGGVWADVTETKRAEREARSRAARESALADLSRMALSGPPIEELCASAATRLGETLELDAAQVLELEPGGQEFLVRGSIGVEIAPVGTTIPADGPAGHVVSTGGHLVVRNYEQEDRFEVPEQITRTALRSSLHVAIEGTEGPFGVIAGHSLSRRRFSPEEEAFADSFGAIISAAVARAQAREMEARLRQAQRLESIGKLAGGVAHDFNNLLSVILNYAMFLARDLDGGAREQAEAIQGAAERAADLTRRLLLFGRQMPMFPQEVDPVVTVTEMRHLLERLIGENVTLSVEVEPGIGVISIDPGELEQVVMNLVVNAADAIEGVGAIAISLTRLDSGASGDDVVELKVRDTGEGMDWETQRHAFDPFFTTKPPGEGTGLGLATVHGIVRRANGNVTVESSVGRGTTVTVCLPLHTPQESEETRAERPPPQTGAGQLILLAEDDVNVRALAEDVLREGGYRVESAPDGLAALERAESLDTPPDLLVSDLVMPRLSGRALADKLLERCPGVPVVFMTGYSTEPIAEDSLSRVAPVVTKPFTSEDLLNAVAEALAGDQDGDPSLI